MRQNTADPYLLFSAAEHENWIDHCMNVFTAYCFYNCLYQGIDYFA